MIDVHNGVLVADTVATETLDADYDVVDVLCIGTSPIYFRLDGVAPVVGGDGCYVVGPNGSLRVPVEGGTDTEVKLISAGTPIYSVTPGPAVERSGAGLSTTSVAGAVEVANDAGNPLPVSGTVEVVNDVGNALPVSGPLTDAQLRAAGVPVTGPLTDAQLRAAGVPVDTELPTAAALSDALANPTVPGVGSHLLLWDGSQWVRRRTPTKFVGTNASASGDNAIWTPAAGKKFRLLAYRLDLTANASVAAAAVQTYRFRDATTALGALWQVFVPNAAAATLAGALTTGWCVLGNGILSAAANNVLNMNMSAALTNGVLVVNVIGTEE